MKSFIHRTAFTSLSILTALSFGTLGAAEPQGCEQETSQGQDTTQTSTTTTTSADVAGSGSNANATAPDPTTPENAGFGSMQMPNPRTPLTSYDEQDRSGAGAVVSPGNGGVVVPNASYGGPNASNANGANLGNVNAANLSIASGANGTVAPVETNGYGVTPAVSGSGATGTTGTTNAVVNGTNAGTTDQNGVPISTPAVSAGSSAGPSYTQYPNGIRNYSSASDVPSVSTPAAQSQPFSSQPQQNQVQQQQGASQTGARR